MENNVKKQVILVFILSTFFWGCKPENIDDWNNEFGLKQTKFIINANADTVVQGNLGTKVVIPRNSFIARDSSPIVGEVEFYLEEYYSKSDILLRGLTTLSNGQLLETGGMVNLQATYQGQSIFLNRGAYIDIYFTIQDSTKAFRPFRGILDKEGRVNWIESDSITLEGPNDTLIVNLYSYVDVVKLNKDPLLAFFRSKVLGWINADRLLQGGLQEVWVRVHSSHDPKLAMTLIEINSHILGVRVKPELYKFIVPDSLNTAVLFAKKVDRNKIYYDLRKIALLNNDTVNIYLRPGEAEQIQREIEAMF